jgi:hypothetical protein
MRRWKRFKWDFILLAGVMLSLSVSLYVSTEFYRVVNDLNELMRGIDTVSGPMRLPNLAVSGVTLFEAPDCGDQPCKKIIISSRTEKIDGKVLVFHRIDGRFVCLDGTAGLLPAEQRVPDYYLPTHCRLDKNKTFPELVIRS